MNVNGIRYVGRSMGNRIEYKVNGKVVGYEDRLGDQVQYKDDRNNFIGSLRKIGNY